MGFLKIVKFPTITALAVVLLLPTLVPTLGPAPTGPARVSYNPAPGDIYHAPLSDMGLLGLSFVAYHANFSTPVGPLVTASAASSSNPQNGPQTISQNALRFINDNSYFPQSETSIAVDPGNPSHVVGGFNDPKFFFCISLPSDCDSPSAPVSLSGFTVSIDGGLSVLKGGSLPNLNVSASPFPFVPFGDPVVAPSPDGNFFYGSLGLAPFGGNGVMIAKSNPNLFDPNVSCATTYSSPTTNPCWTIVFVSGSPSISLTIEDKPVIAVDQSNSPYRGSVYIAWTHFNFFLFTSTSYLARCDNNLNFCTMLAGGSLDPVSGTDPFADFSTPAVDGKGNVYLTWCNIGTARTFGPITCKVRSSPPGGAAFSGTTTILSFMGSGTMLPGASYTRGFATEQFRTASIPWLSVDTSSRATSGNLYFTITVCSSGRYNALRDPFYGADNPGNCGLSSILFSRSIDGGLTWSAPAALSSPAVNTQPYITVDPASGHVFVVYYTTQYDPFNHRIDIVAQESIDGGSTFHQFRVTRVSNEPDSDPNMFFYLSDFGGSWTAPQYGDYFQATAIGGTLWVLFTANYAVEHGTFQTDPFLAVLVRP
jgi:hypothetical protein